MQFGPRIDPRAGTNARAQMRRQRNAAIRRAARYEFVRVVLDCQEALRTVGIVLAVLWVAGVYKAPLALILAFLAGPTLVNLAILLVARLYVPPALRRSASSRRHPPRR